MITDQPVVGRHEGKAREVGRAGRLQFGTYSTAFSAFFQQHTGMTPTAFRTTARGTTS